MSDKKACIRVTGKVQGVYFRASTREKALELGIKGFVENCADGDVYVEAEGAHLDDFIKWLHQGPAAAKVEDVSVDFREKTGFNTFQIRY